jgi:hypothetical protein
MHARKKGPEMGSVHARIEAMKDVFVRCHEKYIDDYCFVTVNTDAMMHVPCSDISNLISPVPCV